MSSSERLPRVDAKTNLINQLIGFLIPLYDEEIIVGQVTKSRARNSHFTVELIKQETRDGNLHIIEKQTTTEGVLNSTAERLMQMQGINIIGSTEKEKFVAARNKILEIKKEAKSKIKKTT